MTDVKIIRVFPATEYGGNPAPIVIAADELDNEQMRKIAEVTGHESGFVQKPSEVSPADWQMRYFVPNHEMEMCGHATIGALWALRDAGLIAGENQLIETKSGLVRAIVPKSGAIAISQPLGVVRKLSRKAGEDIASVLNLPHDYFHNAICMNAKTSRTKTLIPITSVEELHQLKPNFEHIRSVCNQMESTGLYPFAVGKERGHFHARQFPSNSGYPEDAATGIAASALAFGLLDLKYVEDTEGVVIHQGEAMNFPSRIDISFEQQDGKVVSCWLKGECIVERRMSKVAGHV
ncbi:PhzF family phenazine biosynthesis protein [Thalassospira lucentensis]|uniref:PhzF family phenazine biosynthesis protein n=1 Tax=Thalassospira lucentensis TaxID=168935 RepID=UPI003AA94AB2